MKKTNGSFTSKTNSKNNSVGKSCPKKAGGPNNSQSAPEPAMPPEFRISGRDYANPVDYDHPYKSMDELADFLALRYDANRTRHAYYRQVRLIHEHFGCDPAIITEAQLRDYFLFVKLKKHWKPKTIRQAVASSKMFFVDLVSDDPRGSRQRKQAAHPKQQRP